MSKRKDRGILAWLNISSFLFITCAEVEEEYVVVLLLGVRDSLTRPFLQAHTSEQLSIACDTIEIISYPHLIDDIYDTIIGSVRSNKCFSYSKLAIPLHRSFRPFLFTYLPSFASIPSFRGESIHYSRGCESRKISIHSFLALFVITLVRSYHIVSLAASTNG